MRRAEWILKSVVVTTIVAGLAMAAVAAGQEFRAHAVESLSQYPPGGAGVEHDPGELVRVKGRVKAAYLSLTTGRLEIVLEPPDAGGEELYFVTEVVAVCWPWIKNPLSFEPRVGETVTVCGFSRFARSSYRWQVNPMVPCSKGVS